MQSENMTDHFFQSLPEHPLLQNFPRGISGQNLPPTGAWEDPKKVLESFPYQPGGLYHGMIDAKRIGINTDAHILTIGGSRSGKGTSSIIPNLILGYTGSAIILDPKGELASITAGRRGKGIRENKAGLGQKVFILDPFNASSRPERHSFNPLDLIPLYLRAEDGSNQENTLLVDDAALVAESLIIRSENGSDHWDDTAQDLLKGLILYVLLEESGTGRNLIRVREILRSGDIENRHKSNLFSSEETVLPEAPEKPSELLEWTLNRMVCLSEKTVGDTSLCRARQIMGACASSLLAKPDGERGSVLSTARRHTQFLDSDPMRDVLSRSSEGFSLADLKKEKMTVYICFPAGRMATHHRWLRLLISMTLEMMERDKKSKPDFPVLFLLEEFPVLGHMRSIETAVGQIAGFGVKLWFIIQDIPQLQKHYPHSWETFVGNSGVVQCFGMNDNTTLEYVSKRLGTTSIVMVSETGVSMTTIGTGNTGKSWSVSETTLMTPEEVSRFFSGRQNLQILFVPGLYPLVTQKVDYFKDNELVGCYDPDPRYRKCADIKGV